MSDEKTDDNALRTQLDELRDALGDVRATLEQQSDSVTARLRPFVDQMRTDWEAARDAVERTGSATRDALHVASEDTEADIGHLRSEVATVMADLRAEAAGSRDAYGDALSDVIESWRARIDQLRVQADLGRRDARERVGADVDRVEKLWSDLRTRAERFADQATEVTEEMRDDLRDLLDDLRAALRSAVDHLAESAED